jgi:glycosyltransferase EpsE
MHSGSPLISVLMPVYNCAKYLSEAVDSIIYQTYDNWELLICDDGSRDESVQIMSNYALIDSRIKAFTNEENRGAAHTKNLLIKKAKGEFIALMDADDISDKNRLRAQLMFLKENCLDACGTHHRTIDEDGVILERHLNYGEYEQILWSAFSNFSFCNASLLIKRECLLKIGGYNEALRSEAEDIDMLSRFLLSGYKIQTINKVYYIYRQHAKSVSQRSNTLQKHNSYIVTKCIISKILGSECSDEFARFMKYFHRPDFKHDGDCLFLFATLKTLVAEVENQILAGRFKNKSVKMDIAKKLLFLAVNDRHNSKVRSFMLLLQSIWFLPSIACLTLKKKWRAAL